SSTIMPSWKDVPVRKYLEQELRFRVFLINTPQAKVLAEHLFGKGRGINDLVFIEYGEGIACGIISDGRPIGGYMEIAGEMGHFNFPGREEKCRCGNKGCLEAIASIPSIEKRIRKIVIDKSKHLLKGNTSIEDIVYAFERGESLSVEVLNDVSDILGIAVGNVVKLLNPEVVVFDRNFKRMGNKFINRVFNNVKKNIISGEKIKFKISDMGKEQGALGGAALTLQNFLKKT
ncbi:MAG: ROK family protein, partial [Candidatus Omnitrophica bacterium]|nr:ROK family protein [Candidatus Omnitrophota bacterium]